MEGFGWSWRSQKNPRDQREQSSMDLPSPITRQQSQTQYIKNLCPYPYLWPPPPLCSVTATLPRKMEIGIGPEPKKLALPRTPPLTLINHHPTTSISRAQSLKPLLLLHLLLPISCTLLSLLFNLLFVLLRNFLPKENLYYMHFHFIHFIINTDPTTSNNSSNQH